jgi:HEAT repeat protein
VRREAAVALGQLKDPASLPGLLDALSDSELPVRRAAAAAIAALGEAALPGLQGRLPEASPEQRAALAEILGGLGVADAVSPLLGLTQDNEAAVRGAAVIALGKLARPEAIPALTACLQDTTQPPNVDEPICYLAAAALRAIGTSEALAVVDDWRGGQTPAGIQAVQSQAAPAAESDALLVQLVSPDWQLRRDAISALAQRGDRTYLPLIAESLRDDDVQVRWAAARALGDFPYDPAAADALVAALADPEALVADEAVSSLARIGGATVQALIAALKSKNPDVRAGAVDALSRIGDRSALPALKKVSKDKTRSPREDQTVGALALVAIARLSAEPTPPAEAPVAAAAGVALGAAVIKPLPSAEPVPLPPAAEPTKKAPVTPVEVVKGGVDEVPVSEEPSPVKDLPADLPVDTPAPAKEPAAELPVETPVNDSPSPVAPAPAVGLPPAVTTKQLPPAGFSPVTNVTSETTWDDLPALLAALSDPEWTTREQAAKDIRAQARALRGMDDPNAVGLLAEALRDDDYTVRWAVVGALAWLRDDSTIPMLLEAMHDRHFTVRLAVIRAFVEIGSASVAPALAERLRDPHPLVREKAAEALGMLRANEAEESLLAALSDPEPFVRRAAAEALGELRLPVQTEPLIAALDDDDAFVRMAAAEALGRLGDAAAVPKLIEHLNDYGGAEWDQNRVCDVAAAALDAIGTQPAKTAVAQWRKKLDQLRRGQ